MKEPSQLVTHSMTLSVKEASLTRDCGCQLLFWRVPRNKNTHRDNGVNVFDETNLEEVDELSWDVRGCACATLERSSSSRYRKGSDSNEEGSEASHAGQ